MMSAPFTWLSAVFTSTTRPQSCTATILFTRTMPVSVSTETSAICTPPTPLLVRSGGLSLSGFLPRTVSGTAPIFAQASFHDRLRLVSPFTRTIAVYRFQFFRLAPSAQARLWRTACRARPPQRDASTRSRRRRSCCRRCRRMADSGCRRSAAVTCSIGMPSVSAATMVMMVRAPVPRSCVPILISTEPSG